MFFRKRRKSIRAQEFILEDENGNAAARLGKDEAGNVVLHFPGVPEQTRLYVGVTPDGTPRIGLAYAEGKGSIQLEANDQFGTAALSMAGPAGKTRVLIGIGDNGFPIIALLDKEGKMVFSSAPPGPDGGDTSFDWDSILRK